MKLIPNFNSKTGIAPRTCAVTNRGSDPVGFIDTHNVLAGWDREVYVSVAAAKEMGRLVGMVDKEEVENHVARLREMEAEMAEVRERLDDLTKLQELTEKVGAITLNPPEWVSQEAE